MTAKLLDGEVLASRLRQELTGQVQEILGWGQQPTLISIQVGDHPAARVYVRKQKEAFEELGLGYRLDQLPADITCEDLTAHIEQLNGDPGVHAMILQMPLPPDMPARRIQQMIAPHKDAEGVHPYNLGMLFYGERNLVPCTAQAAITLVNEYGFEMKGLDVTIVGHSEIVGKPLAFLLLGSPNESATPTVCHIATRDLATHTRKADLLFVAAGKANLVRGDMVKPGAIVVDIGINRVPVLDGEGKQVQTAEGKPKFKIVGDVNFDEVKEVAGHLTPVPGGVGPLTVTMLARNTLELYRRQLKHQHQRSC